MLSMRSNDVDLGIRIPAAMREALDEEVKRCAARMVPTSVSVLVRQAVAEYLERMNPGFLERLRVQQSAPVTELARREIAMRADTRADARKRKRPSRTG